MRPTCYVLLLLCPVLFTNPLQADNNKTDDASFFINKYKEIAIKEMHRTGIPASITLAQAIIESSWGKGELALESNNFFGIKCKANWTGHTYYKEDDDYEDGELVKSCFRKYPSIEDSYEDHSNFLKYNDRYSGLFKLDPKDYVSWAKGLKECNYATDPAYATKLINTIENYGLFEYDFHQPTGEEPVLAVAEAPREEIESVTIFQPYTITNNPQRYEEAIDEADEMEVPEAYRIPENYVRNSYAQSVGRKVGQVAETAKTVVRNSAITSDALLNSTETYGNYQEETRYISSESQEENTEVEGAAYTVEQTIPTYPKVHSPIKKNRVNVRSKQANRSNSLNNRRLPRVRSTRK